MLDSFIIDFLVMFLIVYLIYMLVINKRKSVYSHLLIIFHSFITKKSALNPIIWSPISLWFTLMYLEVF